MDVLDTFYSACDDLHTGFSFDLHVYMKTDPDCALSFIYHHTETWSLEVGTKPLILLFTVQRSNDGAVKAVIRVFRT